MPEPTFLHIQGRGDSTTRMLELPIGPVRIGRGPHCEVRLVDPGLGDVHCMLRRRGTTWHFQPVGPSGHVWIDGRPADQQRPIPLGVPFRVGEHWLILRPADSAINDWGSFETPITVESRPEPEPEIVAPTASEPAEGQARPRPTAPSSDDDEERLRRWEARLEQRERWLKDRQEERRWEARWKSAGETIRAKSTPPAAKAPTPPRTPTPTPAPPPTPSPRVQPSRPSQTPPVARIIEPRGSEPIRRAAEPSPRPPTPRVVVRPLPDPPALFNRPVAPPTPRVAPRAVEAPVIRSLVTLPDPPVRPAEAKAAEPVEIASPLPPGEGPGVRVIDSPAARESVTVSGRAGLALPITHDRQGEPCPTEEPSPLELHPTIHDPHPNPLPGGEGARRTAPTEARESSSPLPSGGGPGARGADSPAAPEPVSGRAGLALPITHDRHPAGEPGPLEPDASPAETSALIGSSSWLAEVPPIAIEEARRAEVIAPAEVDRPARTVPQPVAEPAGEVAPIRGDLPSARAIFAAQGRRVAPEPVASKSARRKLAEPRPTDVLAPPCWSMPLWLGWFPVLVASTALGLAGIALAYEWAVEAGNANVAIRLALRPEGASGSTIDPSLIPRGGWWTSTAPHQAVWAMALARASDGEDHSEEIRSLLDASRNASRLAARSRFVVELPESTATGATADLSHLGRTRDVVTLVGTGRRLRKEGKVESAIRAYRSAMEIASKASLENLDPPSFYEDPKVRRYALPRESLLAYAARAMAEDGDWTAAQWAEALPPSATASLVASRVFDRLRKRGDADRLADLAIRQAGAPTPTGFDPAEDRAAGAEALAYRGRWPEAAEQYRLAIDQAEDDSTRRMWWLNLAEVAQRANLDAVRVRAIEAAKSGSSVDEITRRALAYQQSLPGLASSSPRP